MSNRATRPSHVATPARRRIAAVAAATLAGSLMVAMTASAMAAEPIPLASLDDLTSIESNVTLRVDGLVKGEPTTGELNAQLAANATSRQIIASGGLLGDIVAQVGGEAVSLFRPSRVGVYQVPDGTYAVVTGLWDLCVKPQDNQATEALEKLSPQELLATLTSNDVARGTFVGDEMLGDQPVAHWVIDGDDFMAAAAASDDPAVQVFAESITSAADADLYVSPEGYPVAYRGSFEGAFAPLSFEGTLDVDIEVTGVNGDTTVELPGACDLPISL